MNASPALAVLAVTCLHGCASTTPAYSARSAADPIDEPAAQPPVSRLAPLHVEVWPTVHGSAVGPLFSGMKLHTGDRIGLQVRTSTAADVYLLHCDARQALSLFPARGPVRFPADRRVQLPVVGKALRLTHSPGRESIYIVAAQRPLAQSDPELHALLESAHADGGLNACGHGLEALLAGGHLSASRASRRCALRGVEGPRASPSVARAFAVEDGIVVLRFSYQHLP